MTDREPRYFLGIHEDVWFGGGVIFSLLLWWVVIVLTMPPEAFGV